MPLQPDPDADFTVISGDNENAFSVAVAQMLRQGWKMHGPMAIVVQINPDLQSRQTTIVRFYQALYKRG